MKTSILIGVVLMSSCSQPLSIPDAVKKPYEMTIHGDTRVDNYYWMRLSDEQKSAELRGVLVPRNLRGPASV